MFMFEYLFTWKGNFLLSKRLIINEYVNNNAGLSDVNGVRYYFVSECVTYYVLL